MATRTGPLALSGVIPPMISPLTAEGKVDVGGIQRLVNHLIDGGVSGLFVLGSSGEGPWLTPSERSQVIVETVRVVSGRVPVLAGVLEPSTGRTIEAAHMAEQAGADALVITSPYYFNSGPDHQVPHFEAIAGAISLPLVLYNIPPRTHNPVELDAVRQLLAAENLIGIKDSAGNWDYFLELLELRKTRPTFHVFQGAERLSAASILAGADGLVPGLGNLVPQMFDRLMRSAQAGEREQALALQASIDELGSLHKYGFWLACLKYAASLLGFGTGAVSGWTTRDARVDGPSPLSESARAAVREIVQRYVAV